MHLLFHVFTLNLNKFTPKNEILMKTVLMEMHCVIEFMKIDRKL